MAQDYNALENQIGDAGGTAPETPKKGLGKIQHMTEILGGKEELSESDKSSKEAFLSRVRKDRDDRRAQVSIGDGWVPVNREDLGIRSIFYPKEWEFFVKPATVMMIKNWTAIDESRADQVNGILNEIIRTSVKIDTHGVGHGGWQSINSWDRFWFVLKVRELTFVKGESKIEFEDACSECDHDITYTLTTDSLFYEFPDDDLVEKYWNGQTWDIDPSEYDVDHEPITLYTQTLGKDQAILDWATAKYRAGQKIDENFVRFLPWLLSSPAKDVQVLDRQIEKLYKQYKGWSLTMYDFMDDVLRNITINPSEQLRTICPNCGQEATSTVRFPNGIKTLFKIDTKAKKFGSR